MFDYLFRVLNYQHRSKGLDPADEGLMGKELNDLEKYLVASQEMVKIRGKVIS